jgi:tRNA(Ile)-lysidine synthase
MLCFEKTFINPRSTAVAVSGGPDSMALALLAADWAREQGITLTALTVDHGLRQESAHEARQVGQWLAARNIPHQILIWEGPKPAANVQAVARQARYDLLTLWCRTNDVPVLLLGHHAGDQIETFLLRLGRGSGLRGLSAMRPATEYNDIKILRPLLQVAKEDLQGFLTAQQQPWLKDPGNTSPRFARTAVRHLAAQLPAAGISPHRVLLAIDNLQRASTALDQLVADRLRAAATLHPQGYASASISVLDVPEELALRALAALVCTISGTQETPRLNSLQRTYRVLREQSVARLTLHGCLVWRQGNTLLVMREPAALPTAPLPVTDGMLWDNRFRVSWPAIARVAPDHPLTAAPLTPAPLLIAPLGATGWAQIKPLLSPVAAASSSTAPHSSLPFPVRLGLPALWQQNKIVSVCSLHPFMPQMKTQNCTVVFMPFGHPPVCNPAPFTYIQE